MRRTASLVAALGPLDTFSFRFRDLGFRGLGFSRSLIRGIARFYVGLAYGIEFMLFMTHFPHTNTVGCCPRESETRKPLNPSGGTIVTRARAATIVER